MIEDRLNKLLEDNGLYDADLEIQEKLLSEMDSLRFIQFRLRMSLISESLMNTYCYSIL